MHRFQQQQGAVFVEAGDWIRASYFPSEGENYDQAVAREVRAVRQQLGICDVSTLGKFEICGPDALAFIEFVFANNFASLQVGKPRHCTIVKHHTVFTQC